ncbi:MAG: VWA domain-containing protein, partial [Saprospiraceae bacterium]|nr:VWA domain-containing protein [Saprospiraceae bacterium]
MSFRTILLFLTLLISVSHELYTQGSSPLIFIYDASKSMSEELNGQTKVNLVNEVLTNVVSAIPEDRSLGLLAYGHRKTKDCEDIEWLASPDSMNKDEIVTALRSLSPRGSAPLGSAVANALKVVNEIEGGATVILITAGIETCGGNICEVVKDQGYKGAKFKFHIIGLGIEKMNIDALRCSTIFGKGQYFEAGTTTSLYQAVNQAINATVDQPDRNFSIYAQKNGELIDADVNITGMGDTTESITLRTFRDTAKVYLTPGSYNIDIKPFDDTHVESIVLQNVSIPEEGKVERSVSFGSGKLSVSSTLNDLPWDAEISIIDIQDKSKVASGRTFGKT